MKNLAFSLFNLQVPKAAMMIAAMCILASCGKGPKPPGTIDSASEGPDELVITATPATITSANTSTMSSTGGKNPVVWTVVSGPASVNSSTAVVTPAGTGTITIRGADSGGQKKETTITVNANLAVTPTTLELMTGESAPVAFTGGVPPMTAATISGSVLSAPIGIQAQAGAGPAVSRFTDAVGNHVDVTTTVADVLAIAPAAATVVRGGTLTLAATGGFAPYVYSVESGGGSLSSDVYTAPMSAGTATVRVTDRLGHAADSTIVIAPPVIIAPATLTLAVLNTQTFTASGGVAPYTYSVASGGGSMTVDSYMAPATAGTATVRVTDSLGQTSDSAVTINPALAISPATITLAANGATTFTSTGGVSPYTYSVVSGGGSVSAMTGAFSAPSSAATVIVRATDARGNQSDATVTVLNALTISPTTLTLAALDTSTFTAANGQSPYTFSVIAGGGSIDSSTGVYSAPASASTVSVQVTDSLGSTATAAVTVVDPLAISPTAKTLAVNNAQTFTSTGGLAPKTYSIVSGGGTIDSSTGAFTAPSSAGTVVVRVTDSLSRTADATVTVNPALAISPATVSITTAQTQTFTASGGVSAYAYSVQSGGGSVNASGVYTPPASAGTAVVRVTDSLGNTADSNVTILPVLAISPATVTITSANTTTFTAAGGQTPYTYSVNSGTGSVDSSTGVYTPTIPGSVVVRVTDALGNTSDASVTVNAALAVSPASVTKLVNQTQTFTTSGGVGTTTFSIVSGGGSIDSSTGSFTAPSSAANIVVRATDALGNTSDSTVTIVIAPQISPTTKTLAVNNAFTFTATGGQTPYTYSITSGGGSIDFATGAFTAPATAGTVNVRVTDSLGGTSDAVVTVNAALAISPATKTLAPNGAQTFTATGGVSPYTYSVVSGGGTINSSTGAFTAPSSSATVTVRVTDSLSNTSNATVTVVNSLAISPTTKTLAVNNAFTFTATGGSTPYVYSIQSGGGSINSSTGAFTAPASAGTVVVKVTDSLTNTSTATVTVAAALAISPTSAGVVTGGTKNFSATGGVSPYTYSVVSGDGTINSSTGVFTAGLSAGGVTVRVTDSLSNTANATVNVVLPLEISPTSSNVEANDVVTFSASGGQTPYTFSVYSGGGSMESSSGDYTTPTSAASVVVRVTDAIGLTADANVEVYETLQITPATVTVGPNSVTGFEATGGLGTLTFGIVSGDGSIDPVTGDFTAPATQGTTIVNVTDSIGNTDESTITISSALTISPTTFKMAAGLQKTFTAAGGIAPYTYSIDSGDGSIVASTGVYTAGSSSGSVTVRVTDSIMSSSTATITVVTPAKLFSAYYDNCVVYDDGSLRCFGDGGTGILGAGSTTDRGDNANEMGSYLAFMDIGTGVTVKDLALGMNHACAITNSDKVKCWGSNAYGQLGLGNTTTRGTTAGTMGDSLPYVDLGTGRTAKKIYAGQYYSCAILDNDATKCWGYNNYGQLGQGDTTTRGSTSGQMGDALSAIDLGSGKYAKSLALASVSVCAILNDDTIKCWGRNNKGQLLHGNTTSSGHAANTMGANLAVSNFGTGLTPVAIAPAISSFCALFSNGTMKCWGQGTNGVLGNAGTAAIGDSAGETGSGLAFTSLSSTATITAIAGSSNSQHFCATLSTGAMKCWGYNNYGQLGLGDSTSRGSTSGQMGDSLPAVSLGTGFTLQTAGVGLTHTCAMSSAKKFKCWGRATNGVIGNGTSTTNIGAAANQMGDFLAPLGL